MRLPAGAEKALARLSEGALFADLYLEATRSLRLVLEGERLEEVSLGEDAGAGLRRLNPDFHTAFGFTNDLSAEALKALARELSRKDSGGRPRSFEHLFARPAVRVPLESETLAEKISRLKRAAEVARRLSPEIRQVRVIYQETEKEVAMLTSEGRLVEEGRVYTLFAVQVVAEREGLLQQGYEPVGGTVGLELFEEHPPEEVARRAAERALLMLSARRTPGGRMPVVLSAEAGGTMIHEAVGHGLEADHAEEGFSVYSGRLGEVVASPLITVIDDPTLPGKRGSYAFDDEGVPAQRVVLIEGGVLRNFLYDRLTALKFGKEPNGHGRRESYRHRPIPRMANTFIAPGPHEPEEIIRSVDRGLLVKKMGGGEVNPVTGDFVFEVTEGYLLEGGEVGEPVRGATLAGNGPEVLRIIDMVGRDLGFGLGTCGKDGQGVPVSDAQPTLRIPELLVGGEVKTG
ncbi:TldD/PmbA family protein [Thermosulfurimonas marina]|uniref:TldD/PmbA family protein n=1 Tax=Thermosulfurimonas marina TaxID=2047767 RepID=A0A6H1WSP6_9BACT|nr:TldD/PmbA family protein [Thermosulfurimonas marina]QJA06245.1 TldD/PmbA family protein [Thermosulfurimonas marina]